MGGNSRALEVDGSIRVWRGKPAFAHKLPLKEIGRKTIVSEIRILLDSINTYFNEIYGLEIWDPKLINSIELFNGSARSFFDSSIDEQTYINVKPLLGDIDITVPKHLSNKLWNFLKDLEGTLLTENIIYVGSNKTSEVSVGEQINSVFELTVHGKRYLFQIDWEFVDFLNGKPTEWATFSKSSDFQDMKLGIKGVFHKYLLRALTRNASILKQVIVLTPTSSNISEQDLLEQDPTNLTKPRPSKPFLKKPNINQYAFSILYGIRDKIEFISDLKGRPLEIEIDGIPRRAVKIKPVEGSIYISDLPSIFEILFQTEPNGQVDKLRSFVGLIDLIAHSNTPTQKQLIVNEFIDLLWGLPGNNTVGQALDRDSWEIDKHNKCTALTQLCNGLNVSIDSKLLDKIWSTYYGENGNLYNLGRKSHDLSS